MLKFGNMTFNGLLKVVFAKMSAKSLSLKKLWSNARFTGYSFVTVSFELEH